MTTEPTETVDQLILAGLDDAPLPAAAIDLIYAALLCPDELASALGGTAPARPVPSARATDRAEPIGTYLASIEVSGFRGIGPTARLSLMPAPGLTIVTGRNGSGKSSFAEAAEFALTGDNKRWSGRTQVWKDGWRNLHSTEDPRILVRLGVENHRQGATVECHWPAGGSLTDVESFLQLHGRPRQSVDDLGWRVPLELYRPFLSYAELGGLLSGRPSDMHDSLQSILGLERLVEIETMLKRARKEADDQRKIAPLLLTELRAALAADRDPRSRAAEAALDDPDELAALGRADGSSQDDIPLPCGSSTRCPFRTGRSLRPMWTACARRRTT